MSTKDCFEPEELTLVLPSVSAKTRRQIFEIISEQAALVSGASSAAIFARLMQKEKDESSATGNGIAIPNARLMRLQKTITIFMTLENKIDFGASDNRHVDIVCVLLSPRSDGILHLQRLSKISRLLKNAKLCDALRSASTEAELRAILESSQHNLFMAA